MIADLLCHPEVVIERCRSRRDDRSVARFSLIALAVGGAAFGAALGSYRGGLMPWLSACKIPSATLLTLAVSGSGFASLAAAFERRWSFRETLALTLAAGARSSLVLFALTPALWLGIDLGAGYVGVRWAAVLAYGLAGLSGLSFLLRALGAAPGRAAAACGFVALFLVVGAQSAWVFRPFLGDPRDREIPLFAQGRHEGGLAGVLLGLPSRSSSGSGY